MPLLSGLYRDSSKPVPGDAARIRGLLARPFPHGSHWYGLSVAAASLEDMTEQQWLLSKEAAAILRESPVTTTRRCNRGEFPGAVNTGKKWLIPAVDVHALLHPPAAEPEPETPQYSSPRVKRMAEERARGGLR